jgi:hypothetical protein
MKNGSHRLVFYTVLPSFYCLSFGHKYVGVLINLWLFLFPIFLFAAQPKDFLLDGLKS